MASKLTLKALTHILLLVSLEATAQTGHWRLGMQFGTASTYSKFSTTPAMPDKQLTVTTPVTFVGEVNLERSITSRLSVKLSLGRTKLPYSIAHTISQVDASGRVVQSSSFTSKRFNYLTYSSLGLTANSPAWGPLIFTAGVDLVLRYNSEAKLVRPYGGFVRYTLISGPDTLQDYQSSSFTPESVPSFTLAVAPHVGIDVRILKRAFISASATYMLGLGTIHRASLISEVNGQQYTGSFMHKGSFLACQAGIKYTIGHVKPLASLQYTPYNRPEPKQPWYQAEQLLTFKKGSWLVGGRVGYFSERSSTGFDLSAQVQAGYFVADRLAVGLKGKYIRDYRSASFPITRSWLVGPLVRYHLTSSRIAPFIEGAYQLGRVHFDASATNFPYPHIQETVGVVSLAGGLSARLNKALRLDVAVEAQQFSYYPSSRKVALRPEMGLTYYIRK